MIRDALEPDGAAPRDEGVTAAASVADELVRRIVGELAPGSSLAERGGAGGGLWREPGDGARGGQDARGPRPARPRPRAAGGGARAGRRGARRVHELDRAVRPQGGLRPRRGAPVARGAGGGPRGAAGDPAGDRRDRGDDEGDARGGGTARRRATRRRRRWRSTGPTSAFTRRWRWPGATASSPASSRRWRGRCRRSFFMSRRGRQLRGQDSEHTLAAHERDPRPGAGARPRRRGGGDAGASGRLRPRPARRLRGGPRRGEPRR